MRKQWSEKNVDLTLLREDVKNFFASKGFDVKAELLEEQYRILIKPRRMQEVLENITVSINGKTNNFERVLGRSTGSLYYSLRFSHHNYWRRKACA